MLHVEIYIYIYILQQTQIRSCICRVLATYHCLLLDAQISDIFFFIQFNASEAPSAEDEQDTLLTPTANRSTMTQPATKMV